MNISAFQGFEISTEWVSFLCSVFLLTGLFFLQKYVYLLDRKFSEYSKRTTLKERKPWALYAGMILGIFFFLYSMFSKNDFPFKLNLNNPFQLILFFVTLAVFAGVIYESITQFGIKTGTVRILVYVVLIALFFYAGFISGLFLITIFAIGILIYFFRYFKKLFT